MAKNTSEELQALYEDLKIAVLDIGSFFSSDFSFDAEDVCNNAGIDIKEKCTVHFSNDNDVLRYGDITMGYFPAEPDIAGVGIWGGLAPTFLICLMALGFIHREIRWYKRALREAARKDREHSQGYDPNRNRKTPEFIRVLFAPPRFRGKWALRFYRIIRGLTIAIADAQTIISLSYGINFGIQSKCTLSAYHYNVGVNIILSSCATITFSVIMVRDYWKGKLAPGLRFLVSCVVFGVLGRFLSYQRGQEYPPEVVGWLPGRNSTDGNPDSTIFLPMACFLDPKLDPWSGLTQEQKDHLSLSKDKNIAPEVFLYGFLTACFVIGHVAHFWKREARYFSENVPEDRKWRKVSKKAIAYYILFLSICIGIYTLCFVHILYIQRFVWESGWIDGGNTPSNPEKNINGIGQLAPLVTTGWFVFSCLDAWPEQAVQQRPVPNGNFPQHVHPVQHQRKSGTRGRFPWVKNRRRV